MYEDIAQFVGVVAFVVAWIYFTMTQGFLGFCLGWFPALFVAGFIGVLWPLLALVVIYVIIVAAL